MTSKRILTILLVFCAAAPIVACGGDDSDDGSRDDYIRDAKAVENKFETEFTAAQEALNTARSPTDNLDALETTKSALATAASGLGDLTPPDEFKQVHDDLVGALNGAEDKVAEVIDTAKQGDEAAVRELQPEVEATFTELGTAGEAFDKKVPESP